MHSFMENKNYLLLLLPQVIGVSLIMWKCLPLYWKIKNQDVFLIPSIILYIAAGVILIQIPYWIKHHKKISPKLNRSPFLSVSTSFVSRALIIYIGSIFSFLIVEATKLSQWDKFFLLTLAVVFSIFCFTRELDEIAQKFIA